MSRSRKRQPFMSVCGSNSSAKRDKMLAHRGERRACQLVIRRAIKEQEYDIVLPHRRECCHNNVYGWIRDGKQTYQGLNARNWFDCHMANFEPGNIWYKDEDSMTWPPSWYVEMMRK
jgi:hypothetical protein